jgi:hypothetical protein
MSAGRRALVALGALSLLTAGWAGLGRMGLVAVLPFGAAVERHGALMVTAIGLLIALERATVVRRPWAWLAPVLAAASAVAIVAGAPAALDIAAALGAALVLVAVTAKGAIATPGIAVALMTGGACAWLLSAALRATGAAFAQVVPWWMAFLVLTIAGERFELARILRPSRRGMIVFVAIVAVLAAGTLLTLADLVLGTRVAGAGLLALGVWLGLRDRPIAAARAHPLARFIGTATRLGYLWLAVAGAIALAFDGVPAGFRYDALLHALFAGFVLSLILAHAPIVVPAIVGGAFGYRRALYAGPVLLSLSVLARVGGDLLEQVPVRDAGAVGIGIALAVFAVTMASGLRGRRTETSTAVRAAGLR